MATLRSQAFLERWLSSFDAKKKNLTSLSAERYSEFLDLVKVARSKQVQKSSSEYNAVKRFDILTIGDVEKLIKKRNTEADPILYFVTNEELYDKMQEVHIQQGHGGINKMLAHLKKRYANITQEAVTLFISFCEECERRRNRANSRCIVVKPIRSSDMNSRGQVDLIDMQSQPDGNFKWILNYQDHFTKFIHLRPLERKSAIDVATTLPCFKLTCSCN